MTYFQIPHDFDLEEKWSIIIEKWGIVDKTGEKVPLLGINKYVAWRI